MASISLLGMTLYKLSDADLLARVPKRVRSKADRKLSEEIGNQLLRRSCGRYGRDIVLGPDAKTRILRNEVREADMDPDADNPLDGLVGI